MTHFIPNYNLNRFSSFSPEKMRGGVGEEHAYSFASEVKVRKCAMIRANTFSPKHVG